MSAPLSAARIAELRRLAMMYPAENRVAGCHYSVPIDPADLLALLEEREALRADTARLDWIESTDGVGFYRPHTPDQNWMVVAPTDSGEPMTLNGQACLAPFRTEEGKALREALDAARSTTPETGG